MKTDGYEFLSVFGEIDEKYIDEALMPWDRHINQATWKAAGKAIACITLVIVGTMTGIFHNQVSEAFSKLSNKITDILRIEDDLAEYTEVIGQPVMQEGVEITLNEVILTENSLIASVSVTSEEDSDESSVSAGQNLVINGEKLSCSSKKVVVGDESEGIQNYVIEWVYSKDLQLAEESDIELEILYFKNLDDWDGISFTFSFSASAEELQKDTLCMEINEKMGDTDIKLMSFSLNNVESTITLESSTLDTENNLYYIRVTDEDANEYWYSMVKGENPIYVFQNDSQVPSLEESVLELQIYSLAYKSIKDGDVEESDLILVDVEAMETVGNSIQIALDELNNE